jgi:FKBP-type peptidyl-prolyl cis-trans isomerase
MKTLKNLFLSGVLIAAFGCQQSTDTPVKIITANDSVSYSYGVVVAESLKEIKDINSDMVAAAVKEVMLEKEQLDMNTCKQIITKERSKANLSLKKGQLAFLEENKNKEGVITTESGLQYQIIVEGNGKKPAPTSKVTVHYTGTFIDGKKFDSSVDRGEPITFGLNQVIKGWTEGVQLCKTGGKIRLFIPYNLAYGEQGRPGAIPPFSTLLFDIELISFE